MFVVDLNFGAVQITGEWIGDVADADRDAVASLDVELQNVKNLAKTLLIRLQTLLLCRDLVPGVPSLLQGMSQPATNARRA